MPMRFQTSRLLSGNVWNRELTIIQRGILQRLRNQKRSIQRKIDSRKNLNSYIQSQTTRKWSLFHGDLPITEMHRRRKRSYIPFLLNPETRSDVIPVRLHFRETIPQARQPISHRRVCMNHSIRNIIHLKVSHGDIISFPENDARTHKDNDQKALSSLFPFSIVPFLPMKIGNLYFSLTNASFFLLLSLTFLLFSIHLLS